MKPFKLPVLEQDTIDFQLIIYNAMYYLIKP